MTRAATVHVLKKEPTGFVFLLVVEQNIDLFLQSVWITCSRLRDAIAHVSPEIARIISRATNRVISSKNGANSRHRPKYVVNRRSYPKNELNHEAFETCRTVTRTTITRAFGVILSAPENHPAKRVPYSTFVISMTLVSLDFPFQKNPNPQSPKNNKEKGRGAKLNTQN